MPREESLASVRNIQRMETKFYNNDKFSDISVRIDGTFYKLHRLMLSLKSDYFEQLFTGNFMEHSLKEIEINTIEKEVFTDVVKVLYGQGLYRAVTAENFASLFIAMDYLLLSIDMETLASDIQTSTKTSENLSTDTRKKISSQMLKLHNFLITQGYPPSKLSYYVCQYLSNHLSEISDMETFLHSSLAEFKTIIATESTDEVDQTMELEIDRICAKWICTDINERLKYIGTLANAVKHRYNDFYSPINEKIYNNLLIDDNKSITLKKVAQEMYTLRTSYGELDPSEPESIANHLPSARDIGVNKNFTPAKNWRNTSEKLETFLNNEYFYDALIKVGKKTFRLHRIILASVSKYFDELFSNSSNSDIQEIQIPDEIDEITFNWIIRYIYGFPCQLTPNTNFIGLLRASKLFKLKMLYLECESYLILSNFETIDNIFEILDFSLKNSLRSLHKSLWAYVLQNIFKLKHLPNFYKISPIWLKKIFAAYEFRSEDEVINMCTKWIAYDMENRYPYIYAFVVMLNGNSILMPQEYKINNKDDTSETYNEKDIEKKLIEIFNQTKLLPSTIQSFTLHDDERPFFMISSENEEYIEVDFRNANWKAITGLYSFYMDRGFHSNFDYEYQYDQLGSKAATILHENLFIVYKVEEGRFFNSYNFFEKKLYSLAPYHSSENWNDRVALLSCNDQIYSFDAGAVWKYSAMLNRWYLCYKMPLEEKYLYTSDSKRLFRIPERSGGSKCIGFYDERLKSWNSLPQFPNKDGFVKDISIINQNLCVLFPTYSAIFDERSYKWTDATVMSELVTRYPTTLKSKSCFSRFKQNKDEILYIVDDRLLFSFSTTDNNWTLKEKNIPENIEIIHFHN